MHRQLSKNLHHQQHQTPATHTSEEDPGNYHHQTHTTLASLLLARNNNRPQQIWQLRLLQLQQLQLLSNQMDHSQPLPLHRLPPQLHNKLQTAYRLLYGEPLESLEDLAVLETLMDLVGLEDPTDQENQEDLLLLQVPQWPQQPHHLPIMMRDSWGVYPSLTRETRNSQGPSLISLLTTSKPTHESQDSISQFAKYQLPSLYFKGNKPQHGSKTWEPGLTP
jgi:hypothetical protein